MSRGLAVIVIASFALACTKRNPTCEQFPDIPGCGVDAAPPPPPVCTTNMDCTSPLGVCDVAGNACVQCLDDQTADCSNPTPACGPSHVCEACDAHADCASGVCLPDGTCVTDPTTVAYVAAGGAGTMCTQTAPCDTLNKGLATQRPKIKVTGIVVDSAATVIDGRTVEIFADPDSTIARSTTGAILDLANNATVTIHQLAFVGGGVSGFNGISAAGTTTTTPRLVLDHSSIVNTSVGLFLKQASATIKYSNLENNVAAITLDQTGTAALAVESSTIANNSYTGIYGPGSISVFRSKLIDNRRAGIEVADCTCIIVGNLFLRNGSTSGAGGLFMFNGLPGSRIDFNTFVKNVTVQTAGREGGGMFCDSPSITARNNILWKNAPKQVAGACSHAFSDLGPIDTISGNSNVNLDPMFIDEVSDLHLMATSPLRGLADPTSDLSGQTATDFDGDQRQLPADLGADEVP
ncbi:MAG: right-handed parallel beta-helix repeat-containing protein [Proteobacteria bacterium]|nr:right-handed parallel beta-helix repeat-containing protein [Pseudomonadota bacterium]